MKRFRWNLFTWLPQRLALWAYVVLWVLIYVATQYRAEMKVRRFYELQRALSEKRAEYLQLNATVSELRRYSALKPMLDSLGLALPKSAPYVISYHGSARQNP